MSYTIPPRLLTITAEADRIAPGRRKSSDGALGDAAHRAEVSDHNPDPRTGIVHACDLSQSMPGAPYWEARFQQFDVHAYQRQIAAAFVAAPVSSRSARWPWLADGGYMVGYNGRVDTIFNPSVSFGWRQNGAAKSAHANHGHFSIGHTARSENDTQPIFTLGDDDMPSEAETRRIVDEIVHDYADRIVKATAANINGAVDRLVADQQRVIEALGK